MSGEPITTESIETVPGEGQDVDLKGALSQSLGSQDQPGQAVQTPVSANLEGWEADKRFESMWAKDPNKMYQSYREMEKLQEPLKQDLDRYKREHQELSEYKTQYSSVVDYVTQLANHPEYKDRLNEFVESISQAEKQRMFGDLPDDVVAKIQEGQTANAKLQELEREKAEQAEHETLVESFTGVLSDISGFCDEHNINWDEKTREEFVAYAKEQGKTTPQDFHVLFFKHVTPLLKSEFTQRGEKSVIQNLNKNKSAAIPGAASSRQATPPATPEPTVRQALERVFN